jgi:hypothetical protein
VKYYSLSILLRGIDVATLILQAFSLDEHQSDALDFERVR